MTLKITSEDLRSLIPNVLKEVQGEPLLIDKITPHIDSAISWLSDNVAGHLDIPVNLEPLAKKIVVVKAFAEAIPSLDLTLTPAGFSVISTEGRAPASKERVERLISSLISFVEANIPPFLSSLLKVEDWRNSPMGRYWLDTFMFGLDDALANKRDKDILTTYRIMRESALRFQSEIELNFLGKNVLAAVKGAVYEEDSDNDRIVLWQQIRRAELRYISFHSRDQKAKCPVDHELWHLMQPVLYELKSCYDLYLIWLEEMGDIFNDNSFKNTRKGCYFF